MNQVEPRCDDPSARTQMQAVRAAARALGSTDLMGLTVYASGYFLPMCLTGVREVFYAYSNEDGGLNNLSAERGYTEIARPLAQHQMLLRALPVRDQG